MPGIDIETVKNSLSGGMNFNWVQNFADTLNIEEFQNELGILTTFAHTLCGLFALFYVCRIVWRSWANGTQIDIYKCLKPFAIGMAIMFFSEITAGVDFLTTTLGKATQEFSNACGEKSMKQFEEVTGYVMNTDLVNSDNKTLKDYDNVTLETEVSKEIKQGTQAKEEGKTEFFSSITGLVGKIADKIGEIPSVLEGAFWGVLREVCVLFASIVSCCIICMGFIGKCVFYFFGPFLFAMELIPGMEGRIVGWFKKYLTFSLYPCLLNLVNGVLSLLMISLNEGAMNTDIVQTFCVFRFQSVGLIGEIHFIVSFIGAFMFMSIPSLANQIMDTASNALGGSGMIPVSFVAGKAGDQIASKIGRGAAAKATGGMSEVVNTAKNVGRQASSDSNFKG